MRDYMIRKTCGFETQFINPRRQINQTVFSGVVGRRLICDAYDWKRCSHPRTRDNRSHRVSHNTLNRTAGPLEDNFRTSRLRFRLSPFWEQASKNSDRKIIARIRFSICSRTAKRDESGSLHYRRNWNLRRCCLTKSWSIFDLQAVHRKGFGFECDVIVSLPWIAERLEWGRRIAQYGTQVFFGLRKSVFRILTQRFTDLRSRLFKVIECGGPNDKIVTRKSLVVRKLLVRPATSNVDQVVSAVYIEFETIRFTPSIEQLVHVQAFCRQRVVKSRWIAHKLSRSIVIFTDSLVDCFAGGTKIRPA